MSNLRQYVAEKQPINIRQLDMQWTNTQWTEIPKFCPGRLYADDFVYFNWPASINPKDYVVALESLDTASNPYRSFSPCLKKQVEVPHVKLGQGLDGPKIFVLPHDGRRPAFYSVMQRGSTYDIPETHGKNGVFQMKRHGNIV